jgi:Ser/Thr protein kinase RdoA (MazF antagonist)
MTHMTDAWFDRAAGIMAATPDAVDPACMAELLARQYGLKGQITLLASEIERTADVALPDGRRLILKTSSWDGAVDSFAFQSATLAALHAAPGIHVPAVLSTLDGDLVFDDGGVRGYLQTRLEGEALHHLPPSAARGRQIGAAVGSLTRALASISAPGAQRPVLWNIACWPRLMQFAEDLPAGPVRALVHAAMDDHLHRTLPLLKQVPWQITHNDPSPHNMLQTPEGVGFIDFGDGGHSPRLQDLAIAASHFVFDPALPLGGAEHLIAGHAGVQPLTAPECRVLVGLIRARQAAMILINHWRARLSPAEAAYITKNVARAVRGLEILAPLTPASAEAAVLAAHEETPCDRLTG